LFFFPLGSHFPINLRMVWRRRSRDDFETNRTIQYVANWQKWFTGTFNSNFSHIQQAGGRHGQSGIALSTGSGHFGFFFAFRSVVAWRFLGLLVFIEQGVGRSKLNMLLSLCFYIAASSGSVGIFALLLARARICLLPLTLPAGNKDFTFCD
jgi:hypothetical protein